jgi:hypothetical protein
VAATIGRLKRAGRIEERAGKLYTVDRESGIIDTGVRDPGGGGRPKS